MRPPLLILLFISYSSISIGQGSKVLFDLFEKPRPKFLITKYLEIQNLFSSYTDCSFAHPILQADSALVLRKMLKEGKKSSFLQVTGNILYDFNYNSRIDTPYFQNDVYQHTIQTYLNVQVQEHYPVKVYFTVSFSNSNILQNFSNLNFQFDRFDFINRIKNKLRNSIPAPNEDSLLSLQKLINQKTNELSSLRRGKANPAYIQRQVEELERKLYGRNNHLDSLQKNSIEQTEVSSEKENIIEINKKIDSLNFKIKGLQDRYRVLRSIAHINSADIQSRIEKAKTSQELKEVANDIGLPDTALPKGYKFFTNLRSLSIGRCFIDYSELSAKNISIKGISIEYNPKYYVAFSGGVIDYRYRDFIFRNSGGNDQYLALVRFGKGMKDGNHLYFTYYNGKKRFYNSFTSQTTISTEPNYSLMGITVELQQKITTNTYLTAEIAKSSAPFYKRLSEKDNLLKSAFNFSDKSNQAYAIKVNSFIDATQTKITSSYRSFGANFQSYSFFSTGSKQTSWAVRVDQPFFKRQLMVSSAIRANDFSNPFIAQQFSSSTIFKSIQTTLRMRKLPVLSVGYYPSSQISKVNETTFLENHFYTFNASAMHYYHLNKAIFNTGLVYTQFYNRVSDSNFIYFNTRNLMVAHAMVMKKWTLNFNAMLTSNLEYQMRTLEGNGQYSIRHWLRLGGGLKYNTHSVQNQTKVGYSATAGMVIPKIGEIQLLYDKGFIPGISKNLVDHTVGRLTYSKTF